MKIRQENKNIIFHSEKKYQFYKEQDTHPLFEGSGQWSIEDNDRFVYRIEEDGNTRYYANPLLENTHILNFRDIGGYETQDHKQVRYNCFYRSGAIVSDEEGLSYIKQLNIQSVLDFRSHGEMEHLKDAQLGWEYYPIGAIKEIGELQGNFDFQSLLGQVKPEELTSYLLKIYKQLPFHNNAYKKMFSLLLEEKVPLLFHCSAGKDRTGVASYLILKTLGVDEKTIMQDYLASNFYRAKENKQIGVKAGALKEQVLYLMMVHEECLQASMDEIKKRYPDFNTYLFKEYGIDQDKLEFLRKRYLY